MNRYKLISLLFIAVLFLFMSFKQNIKTKEEDDKWSGTVPGQKLLPPQPG